MVLIGYEPGSKAYKVYGLVGCRVSVTHDVIFDEAGQWDWLTTNIAGIGKQFTVEIPIERMAREIGTPNDVSPDATELLVAKGYV